PPAGMPPPRKGALLPRASVYNRTVREMIAKQNVCAPGTAAPVSGRYEELNVLGAASGVVIEVAEGDVLPKLPRGCTWRQAPRPRVAEMTTADLLVRAAEYRRMAATATTLEVRQSLLGLAQRFEDAARKREGGSD